jgi:hypothetical protein
MKAAIAGAQGGQSVKLAAPATAENVLASLALLRPKH